MYPGCGGLQVARKGSAVLFVDQGNGPHANLSNCLMSNVGLTAKLAFPASDIVIQYSCFCRERGRGEFWDCPQEAWH